MRSPMARVLLPALTVVLVSLATGCSSDGREMTPPSSGQDGSIIDVTTTVSIATTPPPALTETFAVVMPWAEGGAIDPRFTCQGADTSPAVSWTGAPAGTAEFALVVRDREAGGTVHWILTGIAGGTGTVEEGAPPLGAVVHPNDFGTVGWDGPCPPSGTHTYEFAVYALPEPLGLQATLTAQEARDILESSAIDVAIGTGTFTTP